MNSNPILVEVYRDKVLESFHRGVICVVNQDNKVIFSAGDINQLCYPRSAMKLLQVIPLIEAGGIEKFGFTLEEIAVMCGSHNGEDEHLHVVHSILKKIGLDDSKLKCGEQWPSFPPQTDKLKVEGKKPTCMHNNCSGKHAGMLALAVLLNSDTESYLSPEHPVQQAIKQVCAEMHEYPADKMITALDGCSAPIFSVPVYNQAIGYKNIADASSFGEKRENACKIIIQAVSAYPQMVAGTKRYCTDMMKITAPKVIGKTGAEGIFCMAFTEKKLGVCIKIDDGKMQPQYNVAQAMLEKSGLFTQEELKSLHHYHMPDIKNYNKWVTGYMTTPKDLLNNFTV